LDAQVPGIRQAMGESLLRRDRTDEAREFLIQECDQVLAALKEAQVLPTPEQDLVRKTESLDEDDDDKETSQDDGRASTGLPRLAELLLQAGEPGRAATILEHALAEKQTADLFRQLALARFQAGQRDAGSAASRRVLRLDPTCIRSIHNLALAAWQQGRLRIAAGWVQRGLAINRHDDGLRRLRIRIWLSAVHHGWAKFVQGAVTGNRR